MSRRTLHHAMSLLESSEKHNIDLMLSWRDSIIVLETTLHVAETGLHVANVH